MTQQRGRLVPWPGEAGDLRFGPSRPIPPSEDQALPATPPGDATAPGLEGLPRIDLEPLEQALPWLVDHAVRGPVVLTRHGHDAFALLPLDLYRRLWAAAGRVPPVIEAEPQREG